MSNVKCAEARELFSPRLDGQLAPHEAAALAAHLAACAACRAELAAWEQLSARVRGLAAEVQAPAGFVRRVAARLPAERRGWVARLGGSFRRGLAVAAAFGVIMAGAVGYAAFQWLGGGTTPEVPGTGPKPHVVAHNDRGPGGGALPAEPPGGEAAAPPAENRTGTTAGPSAGKGPPEAKTTAPGPATGAKTEPRAFLTSKERVLARTLLRVTVEDVDRAATQALALAGTAGAALQDYTTTRKGDVFQTYIIAKDKAGDLCDRLAALGYCTSRQEETQDLTAAYERDLERYRNLVNQASAADDPDDRKRLAREAEALAAQLAAQDREASQHVVVLWLEQKPGPE